MWNHEFMLKVFAVLMFCLLIAQFWINISIHVFIGITVLYITSLLYASGKINSQFFVKTICEPKGNKKILALTFDDGPHPIITPQILDVLKKAEVKATFFCIGKNVEENEEIVKRIINEGHDIGNHSFSHSFWIDFFPYKQIKKELQKTSSIIYKYTDKQTRFFRPPFGVTTPSISRAVKQLQYQVIGWNVRSYDTFYKTEERIMKQIQKQIKEQSIVLLHDTHEAVIPTVQRLLTYAKQNQIEILPLEQAIQEKAYHG